jgi:dUTP pyrophosphatase
MKVNIVNKSANGLPSYAKPGDAGMDLMADFSQGISNKFFDFAEFDEERKVLLIFCGGRALVPTNLYTAIPEGYEVQIRPRSGVALKNGVTVLNTPGTIDSGYRNSWGVILFNSAEEPFEIAQGDRIAQAVLNKFEYIEWNQVEALTESERGLGGFGSTGISDQRV